MRAAAAQARAPRSPPPAAAAELGALWDSHLVRHRVSVRWGTHSLTQATRSLLWEAFRDPLNQRFVLLSESDVPILDPQTFYRQAMSEHRSRVNAWAHERTDERRWTWRMAVRAQRLGSPGAAAKPPAPGHHYNRWPATPADTALSLLPQVTPAGVSRSDWRKSSMWFLLQRSHVGVVLRDTAVYRAFEQYCRGGRRDPDTGRYRDCYSDEHYLPTLLHLAGLREETVRRNAGAVRCVGTRGRRPSLGPRPRRTG